MKAPRSITLLAGAILAFTAASPAHAQDGQPRDGFFASLGLSYGASRTDCTNCPVEVRLNGLGSYLRAGAAVSRYVLLGGEIYGFTNTEDDSKTRIGGVLFIGQWYPWTTQGFFVRAGSGISYGKVEVTSATAPEEVKKAGLGLSLGVGWDIRLTRSLSVTPYATTYYNGLGAVTFSGGTFDNVLVTLWQLGVGVTWH